MKQLTIFTLLSFLLMGLACAASSEGQQNTICIQMAEDTTRNYHPKATSGSVKPMAVKSTSSAQ